jgi:hypothetical protein
MPAVVAVLVVLLAAAMLLALYGKPSRILFALSIAGPLVFLSCAASIWVDAARTRKRAEPRFYSLETEPPGVHVLRISSSPGIPGLNIRAVPRGSRRAFASFGGEKLPVTDAQVRDCGWNLRPPAPPLHLHDDRCGCGPKDYILDTGLDERYRNGTIQAIELEYVVNDRTRPTLASIDLQVAHPFTYGNDLAMGSEFGGCAAWILVACSIVGIGGAISQGIRLRRGENGRGTLHSPLPQ